MAKANIVSPPVAWDAPLKRKGSETRLSGLDVWYDFDWNTVFKHNVAAFPNGQSLTSAVRRRCPDDKVPCLLLTENDDAEQGTIQTDTHYVHVIRVNEYLAKSSADPAMAYFAITVQEDLDLLLDLHLDEGAILRWVGGSPGRIVDLLQLVAKVLAENSETPSSIRKSDAARAISALEQFAPQLLDAANIDEMRRLANWVASKKAGRTVVQEALARQIRNRIKDARSHLEEYRQLLSKPNTNETGFQRFITDHPRLLGLEYARVRPKVKTPKGEIDFLVERHDGYHDLLELKSPDDPIIRCARDDSVTPASASEYSLGPALANALAQVQVYHRQLTRSEESMDEDYGIRNTRHPRTTIIVGREHRLSLTRKRILRQLNRSLHRTDVMPYDVLAQRAETQLNNLEALLLPDQVGFD